MFFLLNFVWDEMRTLDRFSVLHTMRKSMSCPGFGREKGNSGWETGHKRGSVDVRVKSLDFR